MSQMRRRHLIGEILSRGPVASQDALLAALRAAGEEVTQATVSRDIRALGVVKGPSGYALPGDVPGVVSNGHAAARGLDELGRVLRQHVLRVLPAEALVVLRTAPGHASIVGAALDQSPPAGMVGSISGDDTVFIATSSRTSARTLGKALSALVGEERHS